MAVDRRTVCPVTESTGPRGGQVVPLGGAQPLRGLASQAGDQLEVLVDVQNGMAGALGDSGDEQVG